MAYHVEKVSVPSFIAPINVADRCVSLDRRMSSDPVPPFSKGIGVADMQKSTVFKVTGEETLALLPHGLDADRLNGEISAGDVEKFFNDTFSKLTGRERDWTLNDRSLKRVELEDGCIAQRVMTREQYQAFVAYAAKAPGHAVITACINNVGTIDELFNLALTHCSVKDLGYIVYKAGLEIDNNFDHPHSSNRLTAIAKAVQGWLDDKV